jgi:hypothetical protein
MADAKAGTLAATLKFSLPDGSEQTHSQSFVLPRVPAGGGPKLLADQLFADVAKELRFGAHWDTLIDIEDLLKSVPRTIATDDLASGVEFAIHNTREVWRELTNTLLAFKFLLAQARAFKDVEIELQNTPQQESATANVHLSKIESFDHAVYLLAKVEDLFLLLLFVNLWTTTTTIVNVDFSSREWDRAICWTSVRKGLTDGSKLPPELSDSDYRARWVSASLTQPLQIVV